MYVRVGVKSVGAKKVHINVNVKVRCDKKSINVIRNRVCSNGSLSIRGGKKHYATPASGIALKKGDEISEMHFSELPR